MVHSSWAEGPTDFAITLGAPGRIAPRQDRAPRRDGACRGGRLMWSRNGDSRGRNQLEAPVTDLRSS